MLKTKKQNKKKKGFTLIELIVVLAVLAIIALIAIPNFNQIRENSKIKSDERAADLIDKAVTLLVQDGTITATGATNGGKSVEYGFVRTGSSVGTELGLFENKGFTEVGKGQTGTGDTELEKILLTINDKKGPQSYSKKAVFRINITGLGTTSPDVSVDLLKDTKESTSIYNSNSGEIQTTTQDGN